MATASTNVITKGETIYRENRVSEVGPHYDWTKYAVMGDNGVHTVLIHGTDSKYDRCTCPWGSYNPGEERVCSHIYAAHLFRIVGAKEVLL